MNLRFLLALIFLFATKVLGQAPGLPFSTFFSSQEYQGGAQNFAISQSTPGLIYVANNFGLLEYDGAEWRRYWLPNSTKVRDVLIDGRGLIFVAGQGEFGYFSIDGNGRFHYQSLLSQLPEQYRNLEEVWRIFMLHGQILFCTNREIFVFSSLLQFEKVIQAPTEFESFHFVNNQLVVNLLQKGLYVVETHSQRFSDKDVKLTRAPFHNMEQETSETNNELKEIESGKEFGEILLTGIIPVTSNQRLIFSRDHGIFSLNSTVISKLNIADLHNSRINKAIRLKNGQIAIGTQNKGLLIIDEAGTTLLHMSEANGLKNNTILSLFEDVAGNLWIGHNNGITIVELSNPFRLINQHSGLNGTGYAAHFYNGKLYYGTNNGLFYQKYPYDTDQNIQHIDGSLGHVYNIAEIQNSLLLGHNDGAFRVNDGLAQQVNDFPGVWNFQALNGYPNLIISGGYNGLSLYEIRGRDLVFKRKLKGFKESSRLIEQDTEGNIWVAHGYKGIYRTRLNSEMDSLEVKHYGVESGLPSHLLISVWKINNRVIFTTQRGIYTYDPSSDRFVKDDFFNDYFENILITSMVEDPLGNIFYIGEQELGVLEKQVNGAYLKKHQIFNKIIHLLNDDLQNVSLIRANEVLFAAKEGFIWYRLEKNTPSAPAFPTLIRSVYLTGSSDSLISNGNHYSQNSSSLQHQLVLPYSRGNIRFEYSNPMPNPNKESTALFQFYLEGMEEGFGEWTTKRDKAFTNLPEGKYVFHVRSKNIYDLIGDEDTYAFEILPPWYRSFGAYCFYLLCIMGVSYACFLIIDKRYTRKANRIKDAQSRELTIKESELKLSQERIEQLKTEKLQSEIQGKNKELASATMHLINKNSFIGQVKNQVATIIKKSKNEDLRPELQKLIESIDSNIAKDDDWEQFEIYFDQVHGDFLSRFKKNFNNLSPQELKLSAYLRMNLSSKEIAYLMNISTRGVEIARYRLRKKLNLGRIENLQEFILKY